MHRRPTIGGCVSVVAESFYFNLPLILLFFRVRHDVSHFDIERNMDGATFTKIGSVEAVSLNGNNRYAYLDAALQSGANFYRLRMIDIDGRFEFSKTINIRFSNTAATRIYPVPAQSVLTVQFAEQFRQLDLVDINGRALLRKNITGQSEEIDISALAKGLYFIRLSNGNRTISKQFVKD